MSTPSSLRSRILSWVSGDSRPHSGDSRTRRRCTTGADVVRLDQSDCPVAVQINRYLTTPTRACGLNGSQCCSYCLGRDAIAQSDASRARPAAAWWATSPGGA